MGLLFLAPQYIWILPSLAVVFLIWRYLRRANYIAITTIDLLDPVLSRPSILRRLPFLLLVTAVVLITLALMEPVLPFSDREIVSEGLDIVIVLDLSASMQEVMDGQKLSRDSTPAPRNQTMSMEPEGTTRLETTKDALRDLISRRRDDRIGLVVFSDNAYVVSPLTFDYDYLLHYLDMVDDKILRGEGMTAIGDGIALANYLLVRQRGVDMRSQVIAVFTDGEHNIGRDPLEVLPESNAAGFRVHVVGVDMEDKLKENDAIQHLIEAVQGYGGKYFDANTETELLETSREIDSMVKVRLVSKEYVRHAPVFHWFIMPAGMLILIAMILRVLSYFSSYT
jgi:Ca-activated chloride channel family protein